MSNEDFEAWEEYNRQCQDNVKAQELHRVETNHPWNTQKIAFETKFAQGHEVYKEVTISLRIIPALLSWVHNYDFEAYEKRRREAMDSEEE
jgi:hypothetical protein